MISPLASPLRGVGRGMTGLRGRGRGGEAWTPASLAPYAWYDVALGGSATQITDSSVNARAAAAFGTTTAAPTYVSGQRYVTFDGSNDLITFPTAAAPPAAATDDLTMVAVFRVAAAFSASSPSIITTATGTSFGSAGFRIAGNASTTEVYAVAGDGTNNASGFSVRKSLTVNQIAVTALRVSSAGQTLGLSVNNGSEGTVSAATVGARTAATGYIGAVSTLNRFAAMDFFALLTFSRALTTTELGQLVTYYNGGS